MAADEDGLQDSTSAFMRGTHLHKNHRFKEAEKAYRECLAQEPGHAEALHHLGALLMQCYGLNQVKSALACIRQAVQLKPSSAKYRHSLGVVQEKAGMMEAIDSYERACDKDPQNLQYLRDLARVLRRHDRPMHAVDAYSRMTRLCPHHPDAHYKKAVLLRTLRQDRRALESFREHLKIHPDDERAKFWVAALQGDVQSAPVCPREMVAGLFDEYAPTFEDHLRHHLQYRTPEEIMAVLLADASSARKSSGSPQWSRCVDLGCGTGLMGPLLRPWVEWLEGMDLAPLMVEKAREKRCYDRLTVGDLAEFLESADRKVDGQEEPGYDLLVAADVFVYLGDLVKVLQLGARAASPGGQFVFSTEQWDGGGRDAGFTLQACGRYAHAAAYLEHVACQAGWCVQSLKSTILRCNAGSPVSGYIVLLSLVATQP